MSHPEDLKQELAQAAELAKSGQSDAAREQLQAILQRHPDSELATGLLASVHAQSGDLEKAMHYYDRVLKINPDNVLARLQFGQALFELNRHEEALAKWQALVDQPQDYMGNYFSALALLKLHRPEEALERLMVVDARMPQDHPLTPDVKDLIADLSSTHG